MTTTEHLKAALIAFGPHDGITLTRESWGKLHTAIDGLIAENERLRDTLSELCDIVESVVEDKASVGSLIDSFTTQPARAALGETK